MAYTEADVDKLIAAVNEERAKRHELLMHLPAKPGKDDEAVLELAALEQEFPPPLFEKSQFGLAVDMYDPVAGKIYTIARPGREGQHEFFPDVKKVADMLVHGRKAVLDQRNKAVLEAAKAAKVEHDRLEREAAKGTTVLASGGPQFAKVPR